MAPGYASLSALADFGQRLQAGFQSCRGADACVYSYRIAGLNLRVDYAHSGLAATLGRALAHLRSAAELEADWEISVWDNWTLPAPPWSWDHYNRRSGELQPPVEGYGAIYNPDSGSLQFLDHERHRAYCYYPEARRLPFWERACPFLGSLQRMLAEADVQIVHSGLLGRNGQGILVCGVGGSGKSTTCVRAGLSGFDYLGDDYCAMGGGLGYSLFQSAKVCWDAHERLSPPLPPPPQQPGDEKSLLFLDGPEVSRPVQRPLRHLVWAQLGQGPESRLLELSPARALLALGPSSMLQLQASPRSTLAALRAQIQHIPCWELRLGSEPAGVLAALRSLA